MHHRNSNKISHFWFQTTISLIMLLGFLAFTVTIFHDLTIAADLAKTPVPSLPSGQQTVPDGGQTIYLPTINNGKATETPLRTATLTPTQTPTQTPTSTPQAQPTSSEITGGFQSYLFHVKFPLMAVSTIPRPALYLEWDPIAVLKLLHLGN